MPCCKYHQSDYTNAAIWLAILAWLLTVVSTVVSLSSIGGVTGSFAMLFVMCTMCCRIHRYFLYFTMLLSIVTMIFCFIEAATNSDHEFCILLGCSDVPIKTIKIIGSVSGILWLVETYLIYKIPLTDPNVNSANEMVGMSSQRGTNVARWWRRGTNVASTTGTDHDLP